MRNSIHSTYNGFSICSDRWLKYHVLLPNTDVNVRYKFNRLEADSLFELEGKIDQWLEDNF